MTDRDKYQCLYEVCGWQGGTIHQVSEKLGVPVSDLLYGKPKSSYLDSDYSKGWFARRTCSLDFVKSNLLDKYIGNKDFWLGYIRAYWVDEL